MLLENYTLKVFFFPPFYFLEVVSVTDSHCKSLPHVFFTFLASLDSRKTCKSCWVYLDIVKQHMDQVEKV